MPYCIAVGCRNRDDNCASGVSFHRLPVKDPVVLKQVSFKPLGYVPTYSLLSFVFSSAGLEVACETSCDGCTDNGSKCASL